MTVPSPTFEVAIAAELDALWRYAWRLTGHEDDAADLVQRTCLCALEQRHLYQEQGKLRSWLFSIEHRIWLNEIRSRQIRNHRTFNTVTSLVEHHDRLETASPSGLVSKVSDEQEPDTHLFMNQVVEAVNSLPEGQRHVMLLVCVEGFSYREAATILSLPIGTVMSRLTRARVAIGLHFKPAKGTRKPAVAHHSAKGKRPA